MMSSRKAIFFALFLLVSSCVFSDAFGGLFGASRRRNMALEALLATGVLTLILGGHHRGARGGHGGYGHQGFSGPGYASYLAHGHGYAGPPLAPFPIMANAGHFPGHGFGPEALTLDQFDKLFPELKEPVKHAAAPMKQGVKSLPDFPPFPGQQPAPLANIPVGPGPVDGPAPHHQRPVHPGKVFPEGQHALGYRSQGEAHTYSDSNSQYSHKHGYSSEVPQGYNGFGGSGLQGPMSPSSINSSDRDNSAPESYFYDYRANGPSGGDSSH